MKTVRLTMAQALVRHLAALRVQLDDGSEAPYCAGTWAIFGHGNVAGLGEALWQQRATLPTFRAHNEQGMAHAAIAYAKAQFRQRIMAVTSSIGPGATNLVTAAALAHVNRLPVLLLPGDVFASRAPDPVLQQVEDFAQGDVSANDCFRPVTRYFDRLLRPEQLLSATMAVKSTAAASSSSQVGASRRDSWMSRSLPVGSAKACDVDPRPSPRVTTSPSRERCGRSILVMLSSSAS